jgi:hypothetical protein
MPKISTLDKIWILRRSTLSFGCKGKYLEPLYGIKSYLFISSLVIELESAANGCNILQEQENKLSYFQDFKLL